MRVAAGAEGEGSGATHNLPTRSQRQMRGFNVSGERGSSVAILVYLPMFLASYVASSCCTLRPPALVPGGGELPLYSSLYSSLRLGRSVISVGARGCVIACAWRGKGTKGVLLRLRGGHVDGCSCGEFLCVCIMWLFHVSCDQHHTRTHFLFLSHTYAELDGGDTGLFDVIDMARCYSLNTEPEHDAKAGVRTQTHGEKEKKKEREREERPRYRGQ